MAKKFVDLEEAAKMLGVTPDTLGAMRERRQVFGYRDGANWKFKTEDIERVASERAVAHQEGEFAELDEDPDSILLSEVELGHSHESTSSTIIGGRPGTGDPADSDIQLSRLSDSAVHLDAALAAEPKTGSDVQEAGGSGVSPLFDELDTLDLEMPSAADSGISSGIGIDQPAGSGITPGDAAAQSDVKLASETPLPAPAEGSGLAIGDEELALGSGTDAGLALEEAAGGSAIDLSEDMDDDLVLGGSSHGDVSRTGDSGISLLDPADSGISLESPPLELGGSAVESLELGEDDMMVEDEPASKTMIKGGSVAGPGGDDDFLLTPLEEAGAEESDSGSQVIALEDEAVEFDESGAGTATAESGLGEVGGLLEEDLGEGLGAAAELSAAALTPAGLQKAAAAPAAAAAGVWAVPEPAYSGWNVASLVMCSVLLMLCGMFTYDLMRNMWSWDQPYTVNSSMMNMILSWFEK